MVRHPTSWYSAAVDGKVERRLVADIDRGCACHVILVK
jgi:hypothetical protein